MEKIFNLNIKNIIINLLKTIIGTLIMALSVNFFLVPNHLSVGGFSGIGTIIYYLFNIPLGSVVLILNIPLFIISYFRNGKRFFVQSIFGTFLLSLFLNLFNNIPVITTSKFLACIYGGILCGIGTTIVLNGNSSTGGSDLLRADS